ncbi:MAG: hypothetical protein GW808_04305 [Sphingomonadales bacterium]|nr:hypothetical protein [Sphingomonadales bacterium]PIX67304.1 MAG: hypothetical protein COZ43_02000 [Sphingomonadales bacterium CG_4_10_14_3_um_filter_58_15]NCO48888.1 hypothetical protein [Sphingomonadales bacterium]NCO99353.1 hypothetical protein [Sphingomonadales bacterium]NCP26978.1 hypothetical protein [Sphingomonadales bacterium]
MDWFEIKNWLETATGLDRDSLHIYAGVGVQLFVALFFRRSLASPVPWFFVVAAALINEYYDYSLVREPLHGEQRYFEGSVTDIWNTLLLPSLLLVIARFWPRWLTGKPVQNRGPEELEATVPPI